MTKTTAQLFARLSDSPFDFYLDDDSLIKEESLEAEELVFIEAMAVTVDSEWLDTSLEDGELASIDNWDEVESFLASLKNEGYTFRVEDKQWENEQYGYSVHALLVVPE